MASSITITVSDDNTNDERQSLKNTIRTTKYILSFVLKEKHGKIYAFLVLLSSLISIVPTLVYTLFPGLIINELIGSQRINILGIYIGILILTPVLYQIINRLMERNLKYALAGIHQMKTRQCRTRLINW